MKPVMDKATAREFVARWKAVNEAEREELRATPIAVKFAQLDALTRSARVLGWRMGTDEEDAEVRSRWVRLRAAWRG